MRAYDVWVLACMGFTFFALCELAFASLLDTWMQKYLIPLHREQSRSTRISHTHISTVTILAVELEGYLKMNPFLAYGLHRGYFRSEPQHYGEQIDMYAMRVFPMSFLLFVVCFWYYYMVHTTT
jgi:hypothetical protein